MTESTGPKTSRWATSCSGGDAEHDRGEVAAAVDGPEPLGTAGGELAALGRARLDESGDARELPLADDRAHRGGDVERVGGEARARDLGRDLQRAVALSPRHQQAGGCVHICPWL